MQICPLWKAHTLIAPARARARSASAKTMVGDLPPSSSSVRFIWRAPASWMRQPTAVLPVNDTMSTSGEVVSASPISGPEPHTKLTTPGRQHRVDDAAQLDDRRVGSTGAGLTTTVLPHASAGPILPAQLVIGKLNGVMQATTPTGSRNDEAAPPGRCRRARRERCGGRPSRSGSSRQAAVLERGAPPRRRPAATRPRA